MSRLLKFVFIALLGCVICNPLNAADLSRKVEFKKLSEQLSTINLLRSNIQPS